MLLIGLFHQNGLSQAYCPWEQTCWVWAKIRLSVEAQHLNDLAGLDEVRHLEEALPMKLHNNIARQLLNVELPSILGRNFEGQGQVVAVADTGFDKGSTTDVHNAFTGRVVRRL